MFKRWLRSFCLIAVGAFFIYIPQCLLTEEALPNRYKHLQFLGSVFFYAGIVVVFIGIVAIIRNIRASKS